MKVYISLPISGVNAELAKTQAQDAARAISAQGHSAVNPFDLVSDPLDYAKCMGQCVEELIKCDAICLLPGWFGSSGCLLEYHAATIYGKLVIYGVENVEYALEDQLHYSTADFRLPDIRSVETHWGSCDRIVFAYEDFKGLVEVQFPKDAPDLGYIWHLWVDEEFRRCGRAEKLLKVAEDAISNRGCESACLDWNGTDTPRWVLDWYERRGYDESEFGQDIVRLKKNLSKGDSVEDPNVSEIKRLEKKFKNRIGMAVVSLCEKGSLDEIVDLDQSFVAKSPLGLTFVIVNAPFDVVAKFEDMPSQGMIKEAIRDYIGLKKAKIGRGKEAPKDDCVKPKDSGLMSFAIRTTRTNETVSLPFVNGACPAELTIDWGDGTVLSGVTTIDSSNNKHTYASAGDYTITIVSAEKDVTKQQVPNYGNTKSLHFPKQTVSVNTPLLHSGQTGLSRLFYQCSALTSFPAGLFDHCPEVTDFQSMFAGCSGLSSIPAGLFDHCTEVTNFSLAFSGCTGLQSIPAGLFDNCTKVTNFHQAFGGCSALQSIPAGLFDNCTEVTDFGWAFFGCSGLTSIPSGLFDHCTEATYFERAFGACAGLTSIPEGLFNHCTKVTNFFNTFCGCSGITSAVPKLWDTTRWANVRNHSVCFRGCASAANYEDIPADWK